MKKFILCLLAVAAGMSAFGQGRVMGSARRTECDQYRPERGQ
nr:hypothetical protein [Alistipes onderdonkii]